MLVGPALRRIGSTKMGLVIHTGTNTNLHLIDGNRRTFTSASTDIFTLLYLVNHLSTALLPLLMFPHLIKTSRNTTFTKPRLVTVNSRVSVRKEQVAPKILEKLSSK